MKAPWHGQVIFADWLKGFGLLVILNHGNNYMTLYAHNQALLRNVGDWVSAGDDIAETGATGGNNDMGLYFELRKKWQAHQPITVAGSLSQTTDYFDGLVPFPDNAILFLLPIARSVKTAVTNDGNRCFTP